MTQPSPPARGPLGGLLVLDLSRVLSGPHAAMMLGDLGARVIKVEAPTGDDTRGWGPPFVSATGHRGAGEQAEDEPARPPGVADPAAPEEPAVSTYFLSCNRNKESVTADLKSPQGRRLVTRLVRRADVLVENFRPGVLDRLGFPIARLHELNPALVVLSISGFGHGGPEGDRPGYDQILQGEAGLMSLTGRPGAPTKTGVPIADLLAGTFGACGVLAALLERQATGRGRVVRASLLSSLIAVHGFQGTRWTVAGQVPHGAGNSHPAVAPYGLFRCGDGEIQLAAGSEPLWRAVAEVAGLDAEDPRYRCNADRVRHHAELTVELEAAFAGAGADVWLARLRSAGVPAGRIRTLDQVYAWEQVADQGLLLRVDHPTLGPITLPGPAWRFDGGGRARHDAPPTLGQHDEAVRRWLDELDHADAFAGGDPHGEAPGVSQGAGPRLTGRDGPRPAGSATVSEAG